MKVLSKISTLAILIGLSPNSSFGQEIKSLNFNDIERKICSHSYDYKFSKDELKIVEIAPGTYAKFSCGDSTFSLAILRKTDRGFKTDKFYMDYGMNGFSKGLSDHYHTTNCYMNEENPYRINKLADINQPELNNISNEFYDYLLKLEKSLSKK